MVHKYVSLKVNVSIDYVLRSPFGPPPARQSDAFKCFVKMDYIRQEEVSRLFLCATGYSTTRAGDQFA